MRPAHLSVAAHLDRSQTRWSVGACMSHGNNTDICTSRQDVELTVSEGKTMSEWRSIRRCLEQEVASVVCRCEKESLSLRARSIVVVACMCSGCGGGS